jgi:hypothetical protein
MGYGLYQSESKQFENGGLKRPSLLPLHLIFLFHPIQYLDVDATGEAGLYLTFLVGQGSLHFFQ